jgi:hypothetical protein
MLRHLHRLPRTRRVRAAHGVPRGQTLYPLQQLQLGPERSTPWIVRSPPAASRAGRTAPPGPKRHHPMTARPRRDKFRNATAPRHRLDLVLHRRRRPALAPLAGARLRRDRTLRSRPLRRRALVPQGRRGRRGAEPALALPHLRRPGRGPAPALRRRLESRIHRRHLPHQPPAVGDEVAVEGCQLPDPGDGLDDADGGRHPPGAFRTANSRRNARRRVPRSTPADGLGDDLPRRDALEDRGAAARSRTARSGSPSRPVRRSSRSSSPVRATASGRGRRVFNRANAEVRALEPISHERADADPRMFRSCATACAT